MHRNASHEYKSITLPKLLKNKPRQSSSNIKETLSDF